MKLKSLTALVVLAATLSLFSVISTSQVYATIAP